MSPVFQPVSFEEAAQLLAEHGPDARAIAGGTDTITRLQDGMAPPAVWVDLSRIGGAARSIELRDGALWLGALVDFESMASSTLVKDALPALHQAASVMGSIQIRARGTLGGNLCNASPAGDSIPPLMVGDADLVLVSAGGTRTLPLEEFFLGPGKTALQPGELVAAVRCPVVPGTVSAFARVGARAHHVITKASAALACRVVDGALLDVRFALGAVGPTVFRATRVEAILEGQVPSAELIERAGDASAYSAQPIDDVRSTVVYRRDACRNLVGILFQQTGLS